MTLLLSPNEKTDNDHRLSPLRPSHVSLEIFAGTDENSLPRIRGWLIRIDCGGQHVQKRSFKRSQPKERGSMRARKVNLCAASSLFAVNRRVAHTWEHVPTRLVPRIDPHAHVAAAIVRIIRVPLYLYVVSRADGVSPKGAARVKSLLRKRSYERPAESSFFLILI